MIEATAACKDWFILERDFQEGDVWVSRYSVPHDVEFQYFAGAPLDAAAERLLIECDEQVSRYPDYLEGIHSFPIVSSRFKKLLTDICSEFVEFLPSKLSIERLEAGSEKRYWFVNILENRSCFDWRRSQYDRLPESGLPINISRLVILPEKLTGREIVRIAESPTLILVSSVLKDLIQEAALTGVSCLPLEDYRELDI